MDVEVREATGAGALADALLSDVRAQWKNVPDEESLVAWIREARRPSPAPRPGSAAPVPC